MPLTQVQLNSAIDKADVGDHIKDAADAFVEAHFTKHGVVLPDSVIVEHISGHNQIVMNWTATDITLEFNNLYILCIRPGPAPHMCNELADGYMARAFGYENVNDETYYSPGLVLDIMGVPSRRKPLTQPLGKPSPHFKPQSATAAPAKPLATKTAARTLAKVPVKPNLKPVKLRG